MRAFLNGERFLRGSYQRMPHGSTSVRRFAITVPTGAAIGSKKCNLSNSTSPSGRLAQHAAKFLPPHAGPVRSDARIPSRSQLGRVAYLPGRDGISDSI